MQAKRIGFLFDVIFAVSLAIGIYKRWMFPLVPFFDADSWGYISPAVGVDGGGPFLLIYGRHHIYPMFLSLILSLAPRLETIAFSQHLIGVVTAITLWQAWKLLPRLSGLIGTALFYVLGLVAIVVYYWSPSTMLYEHSVRPESVFPFMGAVAVYSFLKFAQTQVSDGQRKFFWGSLSIFVFGISYYVKPQWGCAAFIPAVPYLHWWLQTRRAWRRVLCSVLAGLLLVFAAGVLPYRFYSRADPSAGVFGRQVVALFNAHITRYEVIEGLRAKEPPFPRQLLEGFLQEIDAELSHPTPGYPVLGYNPDVLFYQNSAARFVWNFFGADPEKVGEFYSYYATKVLFKYPRALAKKVLSQLGIFYSPGGYRYAIGGVVMQDHLEGNRRAFGPVELSRLGGTRFGKSYMSSSSVRIPESVSNIIPSQRYSELARWLSDSYLYIAGFSLLFGLVLLWSVSNEQLKTYGVLLLVLPIFNFGPSLTAAIVHSLEIGRYIDNQFLMTVFSQLAEIQVMVCAGFQLYQRH